MTTRGREVLRGWFLYRLVKKGNGGSRKKRAIVAFCGFPSDKPIVAQIQVFEDYEKVEKSGHKPKSCIKLEGAKIESSYSSPPSSQTNSPAYTSTTVASPQGGVQLSSSPSTSVGSTGSHSGSGIVLGNQQNGGTYIFTITTQGGEVHEFKTENENDRLRWVKLLQLLMMYPTSAIPEEPKTNPIKDSFRQRLDAKDYKADSVWPVYILPEEVGSKCGIIGTNVLALRSGVPNVSMGQLDIINPADPTNPLVSWDRDKMRRTGKTGHLVFVEIGRRCEGGPGLVWMYTGFHNDAQALRETLHKFLFHGDGCAVAQITQPQTAVYDVPRASFDSSLPPSYNKRGSIPSNYHNHKLSRSRSHEHDSGYPPSPASGFNTPPLDGPPVRLDKHPSMCKKGASEPRVIKRSQSVSVSSSYNSYNERELSNPSSVDPNEDLSSPRSRSNSPPDDEENIVGDLDPEVESCNGHLYDVVPYPNHPKNHPSHPYYTPRAVEDEYEQMVHPKFKIEGGYVYMQPTNGNGQSDKTKSLPIPVSGRRQSGGPEVYERDPYNTLQHFPQQRQNPHSLSPKSRSNYDTPLPTIRESQQQQQRPSDEGESQGSSNYENHPLPKELAGVEPQVYRPNYENIKSANRERRGSQNQEQYENVTGNGEQISNGNANNNKRDSLYSKRRSTHSDKEEVQLKAPSPPKNGPSGYNHQSVTGVPGDDGYLKIMSQHRLEDGDTVTGMKSVGYQEIDHLATEGLQVTRGQQIAKHKGTAVVTDV